MIARLKMIEGEPAGTVVHLRGDCLLIGSAPECDLRPWDMDVAERHCELLVRESRLAVRDLRSAGGTTLNGLRIVPECLARIRPGDRIRVGATVFELEVGDPANPEEEPDPTTKAATELLQRRLGSMRRRTGDEDHHVHSREIEGVPVHRIHLSAIEGRSAVGLWRGILSELAERSEGDRIVLDLRPVRSFSLDAAAVLLAFQDRLTGQGAALKLCEAAPSVTRVLQDSGFDAGVHVFLDAQMAVWATW